MNEESQILVFRNNAKAELTQLKSVEEGLLYLNKLKAFDVWVKAEKMDAELQILVKEQKLRTGRVLGELIDKGQEAGEIATPETGKKISSSPQSEDRPKTIPELGLTHKQSSNFQKLAKLPKDHFEEFIEQGKAKVDDAVKDLTITAAVRFADQFSEKDKSTKPQYENKPDYEKEVAELVQRINALPIKHRLKIKQSIKA